MNYYWHTPEGKILQASFDATLEEIEQHPLSLQYRVLATEDRITRVSEAYVVGRDLVAKPTRPGPKHEWNYAARNWIDPRSSTEVLEQAWAEVRQKRDLLLRESDWVTHRAIEQETKVPAEWRAYRKQLRDITASGTPESVEWPVKP